MCSYLTLVTILLHSNLKWDSNINEILSSAAQVDCAATGGLWLYAIIINSELSHLLYKNTQMLKGCTQFLTFLLKLFLGFLLCVQAPTDKFGADTLIYKRDWIFFSPSQAECLLTTIFRQTKFVLRNVFLPVFLHF